MKNAHNLPLLVPIQLHVTSHIHPHLLLPHITLAHHTQQSHHQSSQLSITSQTRPYGEGIVLVLQGADQNVHENHHVRREEQVTLRLHALQHKLPQDGRKAVLLCKRSLVQQREEG